MLLGASIFWKLLCSRQIRLPEQTLILQETLLGWTVAGRYSLNQAPPSHKTHCGVSSNLQLNNQLEKFWNIEEIKHKVQPSKEEEYCEDHFISTHTRNNKGRFIVKLPFKNDPMELGDSYRVAERRLKTLEQKLDK